MSVAVPSAAPVADAPAPAARDGGDDIGGGGGGGSTFGQRFANAVSVGAPPRPGTMTRLKYASYLFAALLFCMVFRGLLSKFFGSIPYYREACAVPGDSTTTPAPRGIVPHLTLPPNFPGGDLARALFSDTCLEATVVYRVSFALFMFFVLHCCSVSDLTCCVADGVRDEMQSGYFGFKTLLLSLLNFVAFAMPTRFFAYYAWACMYAAALFLVIQILLIVDFAHEWNEEWGARGEENEKWIYYLMAVTVLCFVAGVAMTGYGFANFTPHEDCNLHGFLLIVNAMLGVLGFGVAVWVPHGSLLPTSIVFAYTSFLVVSALRTSPDTRCGGSGGDFVPNTSWYSLLMTSCMTAGALAYTASSVSGGDDALTLEDDAAGGGGGGGGGGAPSGHLPAYLYFHGIMVLASMYLAMLGTDWTVSGTADGDGRAGGATVSFWVKVASSWLTYAMYMWSLLAPYFCCKHRDYGYDVPENW